MHGDASAWPELGCSWIEQARVGLQDICWQSDRFCEKVHGNGGCTRAINAKHKVQLNCNFTFSCILFGFIT